MSLSFHTLVVLKNHLCLFHSTGHAAIVLSLVQTIGRRTRIAGPAVFMVLTWPFETRPMPTTITQGRRGWERYVQPIAWSNVRGRCRCRGSWWIWAAKPIFSPALVIVERERECGRRNHMFRRLSKVPVVIKYEFTGCEIEIAEGCRHFDALPDAPDGSPLSRVPLLFSFPPTSAPFLQNVAHIPRGGEGLENRQGLRKSAKKSPIVVKKHARNI